jgi:hypothetical protein
LIWHCPKLPKPQINWLILIPLLLATFSTAYKYLFSSLHYVSLFSLIAPAILKTDMNSPYLLLWNGLDEHGRALTRYNKLINMRRLWSQLVVSAYQLASNLSLDCSFSFKHLCASDAITRVLFVLRYCAIKIACVSSTFW